MSDEKSKTLRCSQAWNYIPSGRQLPRTPPMADVKRNLSFFNPDADHSGPDQNNKLESRDRDELQKTPVCRDPEPDAAESMLKGMRGYQLTEADLEFIRKTKEQQVVKKLQGDLQEVQKQLKKEMFALDLAYASREKGWEELEKFPSCEDLTTWSKLVIRKTTPSVELDHLDVKSLLAMVTTENIQSFMDEKKKEMDEMKRTAAEKKKRDNLERDRLEKQVVTEEMKIQNLMRELADLKSGLPEQKVEENSAEPRAAKSKAKQQQRQRKAAERPQKLITGKSTRRGHVDETNALRTIPEENQHQKPGALLESKPLKASTKKPRRVEKEEVPERAARGRQKPADSRRKATLENNPEESQKPADSRRKATLENNPEESQKPADSRRKATLENNPEESQKPADSRRKATVENNPEESQKPADSRRKATLENNPEESQKPADSRRKATLENNPEESQKPADSRRKATLEKNSKESQKPADSRRKVTLENNPKESHQESQCGQEAEEQTHYLGLRRSKRIANRK